VIVEAADDRPHRSAGAPWSEEWWFDFATAGGELGGFLRLAVGGRHASLWAALVGAGRPYLLVRDDELRLPSASTPEVRGEGVWASLECETALEHWTVGLEAFAVSMDDPFDAWADERGERIGLGFDLEWEGTSAPRWAEPGQAFVQDCTVHGEILVGPGEQLDIAATGRRRRAWGAPGIAVADEGGDVVHVAPVLSHGVKYLFELRSVSGNRRWACVSRQRTG
jgi:hypothetical protein